MRRKMPLMALLLISSQLQSTAFADDVGATEAEPVAFDKRVQTTSEPPAQAEKSISISPAPMTYAPPPPPFWNTLPEVVLRPVGLASLVIGTAAFVAALPFTYVATIESPDAVSNSYNGFIAAPIRYTFDRPLGDYGFPVFETATVQKMPSETIQKKIPSTSETTRISASPATQGEKPEYRETVGSSDQSEPLDQTE